MSSQAPLLSFTSPQALQSQALQASQAVAVSIALDVDNAACLSISATVGVFPPLWARVTIRGSLEALGFSFDADFKKIAQPLRPLLQRLWDVVRVGTGAQCVSAHVVVEVGGHDAKQLNATAVSQLMSELWFEVSAGPAPAPEPARTAPEPARTAPAPVPASAPGSLPGPTSDLIILTMAGLVRAHQKKRPHTRGTATREYIRETTPGWPASDEVVDRVREALKDMQ